MGWAVGYDTNWNRDVGYGVPASCDQPDCAEKIDRGLGYVCGSEPYGGEHGCGLYFCGEHLTRGGGDERHAYVCERCAAGEPPFEPKPDLQEWTDWKMTDESWAAWRAEQVSTS